MGDDKNYSFGIDLLKVSACFGVVYLHLGNGGEIATLSVPIFMFVSAFLCGRLFTDGIWCELIARLKRLYVPFVIWGLIYYVLYCLANRNFDVSVLARQLLVGAPACPVLYFLFLLACYSMILFCVGHIRRRFWALTLILIVCLVLQYSGLNSAVFNLLHFDFRMVLGRFVELLPAAVLGYAFYLVGKGVEAKLASLIFAATAIAVYGMSLGGVFPAGCEGFLYQGLPLLLGAAGACVRVIMVAVVGGGGGAISLCRATYPWNILHPFACRQDA